MLGLVVSLVASIAPALPATVATCDVDSPACEALAALADREDTDRDYATPAELDCRSALSALATAIGECDGPILYDASYRVSRSPESEQVTRALLPGRRERRRAISACDGLPPKGGALTGPDTQPLAITATSGLTIDEARALEPRAVLVLASRFCDPPDRPPRV